MDKKDYKQKLLYIFQEDVFNELMNFWRIVEESEYDYKIFVSKKCYVLYKVFMPIIDFQTYKKCKKITDTAIPIYIENMKNSTVLVIDDVFIHGRATAKVNKEIDNIAKKITFYTFAKNSNNDIPQDTSIKTIQEKKEGINLDSLNYVAKLNKALFAIQQNSVIGYLNCSEYQWKRISDLIMKSLWGVNMPYVSYLPIFIMKDQKRLFSTNVTKEYIMYNSHSQEEQDQHFAYYIQSNENCTKEPSIIHFCFVISNNDFMKNCKMIPMVFFDCENTNININFILNSINIIYDKESDGLCNYFIKNRKDKEGMISLLKYLIFSVGFLASKNFFINNGIRKNEYLVDTCNAEYSFGTGIKKYVSLLEKKEVNDLLRKIHKGIIKNPLKESKNRRVYLEEHIKLMEGLIQSYSDMKSCSIEKNFPDIIEVLARYFKFNNIYNEQNFCNMRQSGKNI